MVGDDMNDALTLAMANVDVSKGISCSATIMSIMAGDPYVMDALNGVSSGQLRDVR